MQWYEAGEVWKGLTDLPIAGLALVFALCIGRHRAARPFRAVFILLAATACLGAVVHTVVLPDAVRKAIWVVLYALLYETVCRFFLRMIPLFLPDRPTARERIALRIAQGVGWGGSVILLYTGERFDIYAFVLYAALLALPLLWLCLFHARAIPTSRWLVVCLGLAMLAQALKAVLPYGVVIAHGWIILALCLTYRTVLKMSH